MCSCNAFASTWGIASRMYAPIVSYFLANLEVCQLRLKLNKQASIVLLRLGPTVRTAWEPIIQHCLEFFQRRDDLDASRLIIHYTMPFHPSALYTKSGKHDRSYQAQQRKDFFADMVGLAAKLGCVDGKGHFNLLGARYHYASLMVCTEREECL